MAFKKPLPEWKQPGIRPPESKIKEGYQVLDKPPAAWMNWQMNTTYEALQELQEKAAEKEDVSKALGEAKAYTDEKVADIDLTQISPESIGAAKKSDLDAHAADSVKHITVAERAAWNGKADVKHTHDASDITTGTMAAARLPAATTTGHGVVKLYDGVDGGSGNYLAASPLAVKQVYDEMMLVKQSAVDGKGKVAEAINGMGGGPVSVNNTFDQLAAAIKTIKKGDVLELNFYERRVSDSPEWRYYTVAEASVKKFLVFTSRTLYTGDPKFNSQMVITNSEAEIELYIQDSKGTRVRIFNVYNFNTYESERRVINDIEIDLRKTGREVVGYSSRIGDNYGRVEEFDLPTNFDRANGIKIVYGLRLRRAGNERDDGCEMSLIGTLAYQ
ncbi:phage tail protein [Paenibacillus dendritiformis]|uniref:phage tail protein n=1 Tax=Paenibacillus dendritiformis TaxID=130049 RepID=UPI000DA8BFF3|nr:phage tail protein [Paenibacillus dendritiformis]PZM62819.1 hypothetical protein DOE73_25455 [Paenibacillus dendritiformis]